MKELMNKKVDELTVKEVYQYTAIGMAEVYGFMLVASGIALGCVYVIENFDEIKDGITSRFNRFTRSNKKEERVPRAEFEEVEKEYTFN